MNPNEGAVARHRDRRAPIQMKEPPAERRWRRTLAAIAISALAVGGVSTLAAAPAVADDASVATTEATAESTETSTESTETSAETSTEPEALPPVVTEPAPPIEGPGPVGEPAGDPAATAPAGDGAPAPEAAFDDTAAKAAVQASDAVVLLVPPGNEVVDKVEICHATSSYKNPYVVIEPAADGDVSGHAGHTGPVFSPDIPKHTDWGDIIPPFWYDGGGELPSYFEGLNWTEEGQAVYENDCVIPTPVPVMTVTPTDCPVYDGSGSVLVELGSVQANVDYAVTIFDSEGAVVEEWLITDESGTVEDEFDLPPGDYTITLEQSIVEGEWELLDEQYFTIGPCPELDLTVTPGQCSIGDDGTAVLYFAGLIAGESYTWGVLDTDAYWATGSFTAEGATAEVAIDDLPPGNFVAYLEWDEDTSVFDWVGFVIEPCQPEITVSVTECPAHGGTGSALLHLSDLVAGVEYEVRVTDRGDAGGTPYGGVHLVMGDADGRAQLLVSSLPADREYTAWIDGVFEVTWSEVLRVADEGPAPIDVVELSASVDFALLPCPAAPVTPAKVVPAKTLPKTGVDGAGELLLGSMLLLGLGGASLIAARRRTRDQHVS